MEFVVVGAITEIETIAANNSISPNELRRLHTAYGRGRWLKKKGKARIIFSDGSDSLAEIHWYEAHGVGKQDMKFKHLYPG